MPPKQPLKAELAKKQKIVEDKAFGLKNKNKEQNVQKYVQSLKQSVQPKPDATKVAAKACKYFLEAVEEKQYGWFWVCPNDGKDCHYRHTFPPGYVLKPQTKALIEEEAEKIPNEEEIENQRAKITTSMPITP